MAQFILFDITDGMVIMKRILISLFIKLVVTKSF